jgi:hypothetical protein
MIRGNLQIVTEYQHAPGAASEALQRVCISLGSSSTNDDAVSALMDEQLAEARRLVFAHTLLLMRSATNTLKRNRLSESVPTSKSSPAKLSHRQCT